MLSCPLWRHCNALWMEALSIQGPALGHLHTYVLATNNANTPLTSKSGFCFRCFRYWCFRICVSWSDEKMLFIMKWKGLRNYLVIYLLYAGFSELIFDNRILHFLFQVPSNLARRYPHLVHVEPTKLNRPNYVELRKIWGPERFDWRQNYALHTWIRIWRHNSRYAGIEPDPETIKTMNHTFGEIARIIYYGQPDLMVRNGTYWGRRKCIVIRMARSAVPCTGVG